jgi:methylated-DNA-[protein]-cysteine S-methyltransferase
LTGSARSASARDPPTAIRAVGNGARSPTARDRHRPAIRSRDRVIRNHARSGLPVPETGHALAGFWEMMASMTTETITFDTTLGRCGVRWSEAGITRVLLPSDQGLQGPRFEDGASDIPAFVRRAIDGMTAVLAGAADDLRDVPVDDTTIDPFRRAVYAETRRTAPGTTTTYGRLAHAIDRPDEAREVGVALSRNPTPIIVPCHRVVAADGALTGFSAPGGLATKRRMLELEGAPGYGQQVLFG